MKTQTITNHSRKRGSALISAIIFSAIASILLVSYVSLANMEHRNSMRSYLYSSSLNLAEAGIEYGVNALVDGNAANHTEWVDSATNLFTDGRFGGNVKVVILDASSSSPTIYAEGRMTGHPAGDVIKQLRAELSSGFQPFEHGFATRNGISFSGSNVFLDSYNSKYGAYGASLLGSSAPSGYGYLGRNINDDISVATEGLLAQQNGTVYGLVEVADPSGLSLNNGEVKEYGGSHDPSRIEYDFYADFPVQSPPTTGVTKISNISNTTTLTTGTYEVSAISLSGNGKNLSISGDVTLIVTGDVSFTGKSYLSVPNGSQLTMYADGDVSIGGNGLINGSGVPEDVFIYGTQDAVKDASGSESAGQTIKIAGNGVLSAAVYAPGADLELKGGGSSGDVFGAAVGYTAVVTGGSSFHFDEALRDIVEGGGSYTIESWLEMTSVSVASTPIDMSAYSDTE